MRIEGYFGSLLVERHNNCRHWEKIKYVRYGNFEIPKIVNKSYLRLIYECITGKGI